MLQCIVANIDADAALNKEIASRYGVASYPTIKFFPRGSKEAVSYEGARSEQAFVDFLNERCGTHRAVGGGLDNEASSPTFGLILKLMFSQAGRLEQLDALAQKFLAATGNARDAIYKEAVIVSDAIGAASNHYLRVMEKVVNSSEAYIEKESKR